MSGRTDNRFKPAGKLPQGGTFSLVSVLVEHLSVCKAREVLAWPYLGEVLVKLWVQHGHVWFHVLVQHQ